MMDTDYFEQPELFPGELASPAKDSGLNSDSSIQAALGAFQLYGEEIITSDIGTRPRFYENSRKAFASDIRLLGEYLGFSQPVGKIGAKDLDDFLDWLLYKRGVSCSRKTYARRVTTLKVFFGWLYKSDVLLSDPSLEIIQVTITSPLPDLPNDEEIKRALTVAREMLENEEKETGDTRPLLLLTLLLDTGIKKSEAMSIVLNHINRANPGDPRLFIRYKDPNKRHKERNVPLDPEWTTLLDQYLEQYQTNEKLFACTPRNLEYILTDIGEQAGLPGGSLSFENLRWIFALREYREGIDSDKLIDRLGISPVTWRQTKSKLDQLVAKGGPEI